MNNAAYRATRRFARYFNVVFIGVVWGVLCFVVWVVIAFLFHLDDLGSAIAGVSVALLATSVLVQVVGRSRKRAGQAS
jgi:Kef-type K+ transport system membrane component KefB